MLEKKLKETQNSIKEDKIDSNEKNKNTDDIEKIIEDAIVQKYNVKADDFSICIQNIIPYNLRDWK